nr:hypothetical protein [Tanacetum cinerariifolium]GEX27879.1 hypothetical protein [Tanacetum cinerariifolium]
MFVSHISISSGYGDESVDSYVCRVILTDSEAEDTALHVAIAPSSPDYVLASLDYILALDTETDPFEAPPSPDYAPDFDSYTKLFERGLSRGRSKSETSDMYTKEDGTLTFTLPPSIEAAITDKIVAQLTREMQITNIIIITNNCYAATSQEDGSPSTFELGERSLATHVLLGLTDDIHGNVTSLKQRRIGEAIRMAHDLMDQVVRAKAADNGKNKRKWKYSHNNNAGKQNKRRVVMRAYIAAQDNKNGCDGKLPFYNRFKLYHTGPYTVK